MDPGVQLIYLLLCCGFEKSEQLHTGSRARRRYTLVLAGGLPGILHTVFSALGCLLNIREKKKKIIYLPTDPVIWFIGSASVSFKGHSFYLPQLGQLLCMSLDVVGLLRLYKP